MSSINPRYTLHYSQPLEHRFSHDSVFLAHWVWLKVRDFWSADLRVLDLGAGCGIVGLDLLFHARAETVAPRKIDFLEIQAVYEPHFHANRAKIPGAADYCHFLNLNYSTLAQPRSSGTYDLIVSNPPYFHLGQGALSPSEFKNRCRFFIDSDFPTLLRAIENALAPGGRAYLLSRTPPPVAASGVQVSVAGEIRGTQVLEILKPKLRPDTGLNAEMNPEIK